MIKPIVADPLAQTTWASIQNWKHECCRELNSTHAICSLSKLRFFPSRLIHVRHKRLRLVTAKSLLSDPKGDQKETEYTALSYCWGNNVNHVLQEENLDDYLKDIPWSGVPKTIQDAASTTLKLGINYLWVDSLCIIQNSEDDKLREIGQMARVYTHATLTIAAKRSEDANAGFLHERSLPSGTSTVVFQDQQVTLTFESALVDEQSTKLDTRGWVLQEYLLSRRLLVIGTWVTEWDCRKQRQDGRNVDGWVRDSEGDTDPFKYSGRWTAFDDTSILRESHMLDAIAYFSAHPGNGLPRPDDHLVRWAWQNLIARYTIRHLSKPSDRTVAISAMAEIFSSMYEGTEYAAGLWSKDLVESLSWKCNATELLPRPIHYQGPSWSWTGINGSIEYSGHGGELFAEVQKVECEPRSTDAPFGEFISGTLKIRGPSIELDWKYTRANDGQHRMDGSQLRHLKGFRAYIDAGEEHWLDAQETDSDWTPVTLLAIHSRGGIILRKNHDGRLSRLGLFYIFSDRLALPLIENWRKRDFEII